mmetsp:Transcript_5877/g.15099  ORF Transcript_5877/g.15099 Transcript_5877/m.15099 type:complete len:325 (+) Transcript_5877:75-1049(+)|eukprot:jgi/Tetstr1/420845/TSEL_011920.t1
MFKKRERECKDCGGMDFVEARQSGDVICTGCGLVAESHLMDEGSEWRTFADNDKNNGDPSRVGAAVNSLVDNGSAASTGILNGKGGFSNLERLHARGNTSDRHMMGAFGAISSLSERLGLKDNIKHRACELYKEIVDADKSVKSRPGSAMHASCIFIACKQEGYPRTFNEIVPIANASKKDIGRCYKLIVKVLKVDMKDMGVIHASDYMRRFCNSLGMSNQDTKAATEMVNVASPKDGRPGDVKHSWDGRSPISIAAAVIYIITMLPKCTVSPPLVDITNVSRVAEGTIRAAYKDLYPERHHLVPSWFATPGELDALPPPATKS